MIVIGEKINASRKSIRAAIEAHDKEAICKEIKGQDEAGAEYIDLNAGTGSGNIEQEKNDLCWLIDIALKNSKKKLVLDAASPKVLSHAARHVAGKREWMLNSVKADSPELLNEGIELGVEYGAPVIALAMDEKGIPDTVQRRIDVCERIHDVAIQKGLKENQLYFDPLVIPISTDISQGNVTFETIEGIKKRFPEAKTTMGLSNISYGLKKRIHINSAFLLLSISRGLDSAICDPRKPEIINAIRLAELLSGKDKHCRRFSKAIRTGTFDN